MKKIINIVLLLLSVFFFSACSGELRNNSNTNSLITLFLVDEYGFSYGGIPYICDSMFDWSQTASNGEFSFYEGENCDFDFNGLNGTNNLFSNDIVRIVDDFGYGKDGIFYDCSSFGASSTYYDGSFDYDIDDECRFYL